MSILDARESDPLRGGASFSLKNRIVRALWVVSWLLLASWTPRFFHPWRRMLLRLFGAEIGDRADVVGSARVWLPSNLSLGERVLIGPKVNCYTQAPIRIGACAMVSQGAFLCAGTHDPDDPNLQLVARPITIGRGAWIAAEAFVGPGAIVEDGAVLGARGVAFGRLKAMTIYAGNPAQPVGQRKHSLGRAVAEQGQP